MNYQTNILQTPAIRVAALAHRGDYAQIGMTFGQLASIATSMNLFGPWTRLFAIYHDDPSATAREERRSCACLSVPQDWSPGGRLELCEIRGGRYAVTLYVGPYTELEHAYRWLYGEWLVQTGEERASAPIVEEYLDDVRTVAPGELRTKIWLPLR